MKQAVTEFDPNQDQDIQQRTFHRMLQLYYNNNLITLANSVKRCIPDLDTNYDNRIFRKNDKIWVEANLDKIFERAAQKLQKSMLSKNQYVRNSLEIYFQKFKQLSKLRINQIRESFDWTKAKQQRKTKNCWTVPRRNKSFAIKNLSSQPSYSKSDSRKNLTFKKMFRVRQFKHSLQESFNNHRYIEKLEKVKLESSFAEFFFKKQPNPEEPKLIELQKTHFDKIKMMTSIRWNFNPQSQNSFIKPPILRQSSKLKSKKCLGLEVRRQSFYKPKSKCRSRNNKLFLNY